MKKGKNYKNALKKLDATTLYSPLDAIMQVQNNAYAKFKESVEVHVKLGIDPRHADQQLRGTLDLPNGTGKQKKVAVIVSLEKAEEAKQAGADWVGSDDIIEKISSGWLDFDILISSPDMMSKVGKLGRLLGSKGLMPNPKSGTVTPKISETVEKFKRGRIEYRNDKYGIIHSIIGHVEFDAEKLLENFLALYERLEKAKPPKSKGSYMQSIVICSTMGIGIGVEPVKQRWGDKK